MLVAGKGWGFRGAVSVTWRWTEVRRGGEVGAGAAGGSRAVSGGVAARVAGASLRLGEDGLEAAAAAGAAGRQW